MCQIRTACNLVWSACSKHTLVLGNGCVGPDRLLVKAQFDSPSCLPTAICSTPANSRDPKFLVSKHECHCPVACADIPGNGILYWTPKIVQALLIAAGSAAAVGAGATTHSSSSSDLENKPHRAGSSSTGAYVVLLSAIPYAAASLFHLLNAWHSQKQGERRWHIGLTWLLGAVALLLLPAAAAGGLAAAAGKAEAAKTAGISTAASIAAFVLLTIAHVGINGANGVQTGLVAGSIVKQDKALGLALYNMIGNIGSFTGPVLIGVLHDATGGYVVAMVLLGLCLAASAAMVVRFRPEKLDRRLLLQGPTLS